MTARRQNRSRSMNDSTGGSSSPRRTRLTKRDFLRLAAGAPIAGLAVPISPGKPKRTPAEILEGHLESIGPEQTRSQIRFREATGTCTKFGRIANVRGRDFVAGGDYAGTSELYTSSSHLRLTLLFDNPQYPADAMVFDGKEVRVAFLGVRETGPLAGYLSTYSAILEEGLFAGVLSIDWPFLRKDRGHLEAAGLKSLGRREFHKRECEVLRCQIKVDLHRPGARWMGSSPVDFFFSADTGRHVGTDYGSAEEIFSDFQMFEGLTLPTSWQIERRRTSGGGGGRERWEIRFQRIRHGVPRIKRDEG